MKRPSGYGPSLLAELDGILFLSGRKEALAAKKAWGMKLGRAKGASESASWEKVSDHISVKGQGVT